MEAKTRLSELNFLAPGVLCLCQHTCQLCQRCLPPGPWQVCQTAGACGALMQVSEDREDAVDV